MGLNHFRGSLLCFLLCTYARISCCPFALSLWVIIVLKIVIIVVVMFWHHYCYLHRRVFFILLFFQLDVARFHIFNQLLDFKWFHLIKIFLQIIESICDFEAWQRMTLFVLLPINLIFLKYTHGYSLSWMQFRWSNVAIKSPNLVLLLVAFKYSMLMKWRKA